MRPQSMMGISKCDRIIKFHNEDVPDTHNICPDDLERLVGDKTELLIISTGHNDLATLIEEAVTYIAQLNK